MPSIFTTCVLTKRKFLFITMVIPFIFVVYYVREAVMNEVLNIVMNREPIQTDSRFLENIFKAKHKPKNNGKSIFFLETRRNKTKSVFLTPRQACSVESAASINPDHEVFLIFSNKFGFFNDSKMPVIDAMLSYKNVHINYVDIYEFAENTPLETWMQNGILFNSTYVVTHTSDVLRFLSLWRYTGTYIDLDVIIQKPIVDLGTNFACVQKDNFLNSAFMNLDMNGRRIAEMFFERTVTSFDPTKWIANGPGALTKIMHEICNSTDSKLMTKEKCDGFTVFPTQECYEINYNEWKLFFNENFVDEVFRRTKNSTIIHFWNYMSSHEKLPTASKSAYIKLAQKYCPRVFKSAGEFF